MNIFVRIVINCILVVLAIAGPWWIAVLLAILAAVYFKSYYELIAVGFLIDIFYSTPRARFYNAQYLITLICVCTFILIQFIKSRIRRNLW